jgi:Pyruvate/2-oxoacid:ferredoxin oxidoreductase delta subunit
VLAPRLRFDRDYCREDCHRCNPVCPSGAIARLSLADKRRRVIGQAVVDLDRCLLALGSECTACIQKCPCQAIAMQSAGGIACGPLRGRWQGLSRHASRFGRIEAGPAQLPVNWGHISTIDNRGGRRGGVSLGPCPGPMEEIERAGAWYRLTSRGNDWRRRRG